MGMNFKLASKASFKMVSFAAVAGRPGDKGDKGDKGDTGLTGAGGANGSDGAAATVDVGTVTTLTAGSNATVANSGSTSAAVLDFGIPKGDKGDKGDQGDPGTGTGDVNGPASAVDGHIPIFDGATGKLLKDGLALDTDSTFAANSDTRVASQKATKTALAAKVTGPASAADGDVALFDSTTGKLIKSGGAYKLTQTGTGSVAVGPYINVKDRVVTPEQFGAVGDGTTDDTTAVAAAIAAAKTAAATYGSAKLLFQRMYKTTSTISLSSWTGTIYVRFIGGAGFKLTTTATGQAAFVVGAGSLPTTAYELTSNVAIGYPLFDIADTSSFSVGDYVVAIGSTGFGTYIHQQLNRIKEVVSGTRLKMERVSEFSIDKSINLPSGYLSTTPYLQKVVMETGRLVWQGGSFDGADATGAGSVGVSFNFLADPYIGGIRTDGFTADGGAGLTLQYQFGGTIRSIYDFGSGDAVVNSSASITLALLTGTYVDDIVSNYSAGFGLLFNYFNGVRETNIEATGSAGRGIKHWGCCGNIQINLKADNNAFTGIDYDSVSLYNRGTNFSASYNLGGQGLLFIGAGSSKNVIFGVNCHGNADVDIAFSDSVAPDSDNQVVGVNSDATIRVATTVVGVSVTPNTKSWVRARSSLATSFLSGTATAVVFDTVVADPLSQLNTSTGTFTAKFPGWYDVSIEAAFTTAVDVNSVANVSTGGTVADSDNVGGNYSTYELHYHRVVYIPVGGTVLPIVQQNSGSTQVLSGPNSVLLITQMQ